MRVEEGHLVTWQAQLDICITPLARVPYHHIPYSTYTDECPLKVTISVSLAHPPLLSCFYLP